MVCGGGGISGLHRGDITFGGLDMQGQTDVSSVRNMFGVSFTEEVTGSEKDIFEGGFKFSASDSRKKFDSTYSEVQREEDRSASTSTQENKNWRVN